MGLCEIAAPTIFEVGEDGQTHVLRDLSDADIALVKDAVASCPTAALTVHAGD